MEDEFTAAGDHREEYAADDHFVGQRRDLPEPTFRVGRDVYAGYFVALRPCDGDERPVWIARATSDPFANPDRPGCIELQYYRPSSRNRNILQFYTDWDTNDKFRWTTDTSADRTWESTDSIMTGWKPRSRKRDIDERQESSMKIPANQIAIIKASLEQLDAA